MIRLSVRKDVPLDSTSDFHPNLIHQHLPTSKQTSKHLIPENEETPTPSPWVSAGVHSLRGVQKAEPLELHSLLPRGGLVNRWILPRHAAKLDETRKSWVCFRLEHLCVCPL